VNTHWSERRTVNPKVVGLILAKTQKTENSNLDGFELHRPSSKGTELLFQVIKTINDMGGRFVEAVKNARWSVSPQEAGDGLESIVEFQVQIKGHNQRGYEDKRQGWQNHFLHVDLHSTLL